MDAEGFILRNTDMDKSRLIFGFNVSDILD